jgi:hypothetical protein
MWVTLLLKNRYESKEEERFLFIEKEKMLCFFSFPKKEFLLFPVARQPGELLWDDRALANRRLFGCGQGCFSSVRISFFFVSKAACISVILLCRCIVFHSLEWCQLKTFWLLLCYVICELSLPWVFLEIEHRGSYGPRETIFTILYFPEGENKRKTKDKRFHRGKWKINHFIGTK